MANPEYSSNSESQFQIGNDKPVITPERRLGQIEQLLEANDENENTIERTIKREQLQEEQDAILSDIENANKA